MKDTQHKLSVLFFSTSNLIWVLISSSKRNDITHQRDFTTFCYYSFYLSFVIIIILFVLIPIICICINFLFCLTHYTIHLDTPTWLLVVTILVFHSTTTETFFISSIFGGFIEPFLTLLKSCWTWVSTSSHLFCFQSNCVSYQTLDWVVPPPQNPTICFLMRTEMYGCKTPCNSPSMFHPLIVSS